MPPHRKHSVSQFCRTNQQTTNSLRSSRRRAGLRFVLLLSFRNRSAEPRTLASLGRKQSSRSGARHPYVCSIPSNKRTLIDAPFLQTHSTSSDSKTARSSPCPSLPHQARYHRKEVFCTRQMRRSRGCLLEVRSESIPSLHAHPIPFPLSVSASASLATVIMSFSRS